VAGGEGAGVMLRLLCIAGWPLVVKVPVLVAGLMITVATMISYVVLWRFIQDQERNLELVASAYLDGVSAAVLPAIIREDVWEVYDALDRARSRYAGVEPRFTLVALPNGRVLAASDPLRFPFQSIVPDELRRQFATDDGFIIDTAAGHAWLARTLRAGGVPVGRLFAGLDIADLLRRRCEILLTLILVNACLTLAFALGGYFVLKRMLQPLSILEHYVEQLRNGRAETIPESYRSRVASEFSQLFDRFNAMARALSERQALATHLAEQEKYAMLGRLASGMAHEVNNPLGGMLNAIDTIQAHGKNPAVLLTSLDFLRRGLGSIRNVARAALVTYKGGSDTNILTQGDLDDLPFLVQHETGARWLRLDWRNHVSQPLAINGSAVRQITLNLLLNACAASPVGGLVTFIASCSDGALWIVIADEGPGLPKDMAALLDQAAPEAALSPESKGLGLWTTGLLIHRLGGHAEVDYSGVGTRVTVTLPVVSDDALDVAA
jgi:signal transduction histidine kinase